MRLKIFLNDFIPKFTDFGYVDVDDILNETNGVTVETIMEPLQITDHTAAEFPKGVPVSDTNSTSMPMEAFQITDYTTAEFPKVASVSDTSSISMPTVPMKTPKLLALGGKLCMPYLLEVVCETLAASRNMDTSSKHKSRITNSVIL